MPQRHLHTCNLCEAMCGLVITVDGGAITDIRGDADDVLSHGHICPKALALKDVHEDPDRLRRPVRRNGVRWEEIGWREAFDEVAIRLRQIQAVHGADAVAVYQGNPTVHNYGSMTHGQIFLRALGTRSHYSATSLDQLPHMLAALAMFGHQLLLPVPDVDRTQLLVIFGGNPMASNGSLMTAPGIGRRLRAIRERGGRVVVVDPRRTETARVADQHVFIRPGTDALLLLALLREMLTTTGPCLRHLADHISGIDRLMGLANPFTADRVADATGVGPEVTRELAAAIMRASSAALYGRVGVSTQEFGGLATWLINVLNIVSGNLDREGGVMLTHPAVDLVALAERIGLKGRFGRRRTRVRGLPEFGGEYPTAALAEEISTPGPGQIRALVTAAGNPVLSAPNGNSLDHALASLDFMVSIDFYVNETTRHAHVILPPTSALEHDHYDLALHLLAVRNTAKWSPPLVPRAADQRHDWEIFTELATRLRARSCLGRLKAPIERQFLMRMPPHRVIDLALRLGPYRLSLARLRREPHGVDLGPLRPCLPERLYTADRRINLAPDMYVADVERLRRHLDHGRGRGGLVLIGRRDLLSNNSWMHNALRLVNGKPRCTLRIHPCDAERLGLTSAARVSIRSAAGTITADLELTSEMMPGVVSLPHGWGHHRAGMQLRVATECPGVSINDVTDERFVDKLTGTIAFNGLPVELSVVTEAVPDVG
jgi:anaerobic selenocysteine-containing dehydrogenase